MKLAPIVLASILLSIPCLAQNPSKPEECSKGQLCGQELRIGGISFRLGMTKNEAAAAARDPIYLEEFPGNKDTWVVREKHGEDLKGFSTPEEIEVGNVLFRAIERLKQDDPNANVHAGSTFMSSENGKSCRTSLRKKSHIFEASDTGLLFRNIFAPVRLRRSALGKSNVRPA